ncbi:MAG: alpha/beta fold hydrolase [Sphingomonadaceae bacterium]|nr:alpha/beta fold hydrolase [Sphingomonadaceae bacterium]
MNLTYERRGSGRPLVMIHGLGGSRRSWDPVATRLAEQREMILLDLPGHGGSAVTPGADSFAGLTDAVAAFLATERLEEADLVGSSMGARMVLELVRRGHAGRGVALDPGGFWEGWERHFFAVTIGVSIKLVRLLQPVMPALAGSPVGRTLLLTQLSAAPWALDPAAVLTEMRSFAGTPTFEALTRDLAYGPPQPGIDTLPGQLTIGWGRQDLLCLPRQAARAATRFPGATLHWFDRCGHFPMWDRPEETVELILRATAD